MADHPSDDTADGQDQPATPGRRESPDQPALPQPDQPDHPAESPQSEQHEPEPSPGSADGVGARLAGLAGVELLAALVEIEVSELNAFDLVAVICGWERHARWVAAIQLAAMAELPERPEYELCTAAQNPDLPHLHRPIEPASDELSLALPVSPNRAKALLTLAQELTQVLPDTLAALSDGAVDLPKAQLVAERTRQLTDDDKRRSVEAAVLPKASRQTWAQLDTALRRAVIVADPAAAESRLAAASKGRRVDPPIPDTIDAANGQARLSLIGPAQDVIALYTAVDAAARHQRATGDVRTLDQLRFDALSTVGWTALEARHLGCCNPTCTQPASFPLGTRRGRTVSVNMTIPVSALVGADDQPGDLEGFGPITATAIRDTAWRGVLHRVLTDDAGVPLAYGRTTYRPPAELAEHIAIRDVTCQFPTCNHDARTSDIDHRHPWHQGGATDPGNLWALHQRHHLGKTHHDFGISTDHATGRPRWITPAGHSYSADPDPPPF